MTGLSEKDLSLKKERISEQEAEELKRIIDRYGKGTGK